jgi:hypothetical protein
MVTFQMAGWLHGLCASKVHHVQKLGRLHIRHALYPLVLTTQTFIYATTKYAMGQQRKIQPACSAHCPARRYLSSGGVPSGGITCATLSVIETAV